MTECMSFATQLSSYVLLQYTGYYYLTKRSLESVIKPIYIL